MLDDLYPTLRCFIIYHQFREIILWCFVLTLPELVLSEILRLQQCGKFDAQFTEIHQHTKLKGATIKTLTKITLYECQIKCIKFHTCKSFNFFDYDGAHASKAKCDLLSETTRAKGVRLVHRERSMHVQTPKHQKNVSKFIKFPIMLLNEVIFRLGHNSTSFYEYL